MYTKKDLENIYLRYRHKDNLTQKLREAEGQADQYEFAKFVFENLGDLRLSLETSDYDKFRISAYGTIKNVMFNTDKNPELALSFLELKKTDENLFFRNNLGNLYKTIGDSIIKINDEETKFRIVEQWFNFNSYTNIFKYVYIKKGQPLPQKFEYTKPNNEIFNKECNIRCILEKLCSEYGVVSAGYYYVYGHSGSDESKDWLNYDKKTPKVWFLDNTFGYACFSLYNAYNAAGIYRIERDKDIVKLEWATAELGEHDDFGFNLAFNVTEKYTVDLKNKKVNREILS